MKPTVFFLAFCLLVDFASKAQDASPPDQHMVVNEMYIANLNGRPWEEVKYGNIYGTPYLIADWRNGSVVINKSIYFKDVPIRFDVYNHKLFFKKDSGEFTFINPVNEFVITYRENGDSSIFRNGYPAVDKNTGETYYEVLVDGKIQLLDFYSKSIQTVTPFSGPPQKEFLDKSELYALLPGGKIVKLKMSKDEILSAMPGYADTIRKFADGNKNKLKTEEQVVQLFRFLNQY